MDFPQNAKTEVIVLLDFLNYPSDLPAHLGDHDAYIWALGKSSVGLSEEEYTKISYDHTMTFVKQIQPFIQGRIAGPFRFVFVSGEGTDQMQLVWTDQGWLTHSSLQSKVCSLELSQGCMEKAIYFFPSKEHQSDQVNICSLTARAIDTIAGLIVLTMFPSQFTPIDDLGLFAVEAAKGRWADDNLFRNRRILWELLQELCGADGSSA
ncbi:hypothetical protein BS17DRAFT_700622 [Gyrodon lividus]|nr:hypothetical protein BS17DRAFT_700622 [Gyrodon lividus]